MGGDRSSSEFSGIVGRVLTGAISTASLGSGVALGLLVVLVSAGLIVASAHALVLPFVLCVVAAALARFAVNGLFGEWSGSLFSEAGGPWTVVGTVALRYLSLTLAWYAPVSLIGFRLVNASSAGVAQVLGGAGILGAINVVALVVTPPLFLVVSVSAGNLGDVFSTQHWRRQFAGRLADLLTIYAVYAGALGLLAVLSLPLVAISMSIGRALGAVVAGAAGCLIFGMAINLLGRLCGFFACARTEEIEASAVESPERHAEPVPARPSAPSPPSQPVRREPPSGREAAAKRPALLAAKQRVDEALRGAEGDAAGALERLRELDSTHAPHPLVLHAMTLCAFDAERSREGLELAKRAIPLCIERGQAIQAAEIFRAMRRHRVDANPGTESLVAIGFALIRMDDLATAAKAFSAAVAADRDHTRAIKGLLQVADDILHRKHRPEAAAKVYRLVLTTCPHSPMAEFARAGLEAAERAQSQPHPAS